MTIMWIDECGRCGRYHRPDYLGDCDADYPLPVSEEGIPQTCACYDVKCRRTPKEVAHV